MKNRKTSKITSKFITLFERNSVICIFILQVLDYQYNKIKNNYFFCEKICFWMKKKCIFELLLAMKLQYKFKNYVTKN